MTQPRPPTRIQLPDHAVQVMPDGTLQVIGDEELSRIASALELLAALKLYELQMPMALVYATDTTGTIERGVIALAKEKLEADAEQSTRELADKLRGAGLDPDDPAIMEKVQAGLYNEYFKSPPVVRESGEDFLFFDRVRQLATYLNVPFDELTDLSKLAADHQWTPGTIADTLAGLGLLE